jgi:hypothetical protein
MTGVPDELAGAIRSAIAYDKGKRPDTALAFAYEIAEITNTK